MSQENDNRQRIEADYTQRRIYELVLAPIRGQYDIDHLKAINHHLFQDLPKHGFTDVTPGEFRHPTEQHGDWIKQRQLESVNASSVVAYSSMDEEAAVRLQKTLDTADPDKLKNLKTKEFTQAIGQLYTECDYIHPFPDGNSRTLREFTRQLAKDSGYQLDWSHFGKSKNGRDRLYIARDLSVNELALESVKNADTKRDITFALDQFDGNSKLPELLRDVIRPERSIAFEKLEEKTALKKHPELSHAYSFLHKAEEHLSNSKPEAREQQLALFKNNLIKNLDTGETKSFQQNPRVKEVSKEREVEQPQTQEEDRGR